MIVSRSPQSFETDTHSRSVAQLILFTRQNLPQNPPHDLPTPRLRQIRHNKDRLRSSEWTNTLPDLQNEVFLELVVDLVAVFDRHEGVDGLAGEFVVDAHNGGFGNGVVFDQCGFDFGGRETMTADVDDVVDAAPNPVVAFMIAASSVSSEL